MLDSGVTIPHIGTNKIKHGLQHWRGSKPANVGKSGRVQWHGEVVLVFGAPGKDCQGHGICKVMSRSEHSLFPCSCPGVNVRIGHIGSELLLLDFQKRDVPEAIRREYFVRPDILLEDPFLIPEALRLSFELRDNRIPAGRYEVRTFLHRWVIFIPFLLV